jgi:hypothetical protein
MEKLKPKRRWFRYSLRGLFAVTTIVALFVGWTVHRARTQRLAVAKIQAASGTIMYDYHENGPRTWSTANQPGGPGWLRDLLGPEYFDNPSCINFFKNPAGNEWVDALNDLRTVKTLMLAGPQVTDATLARLNGSSALVELHLNNTSITDAGLARLGKFSHLRWLSLYKTRVSKDAVEKLKRSMPKLSVTGP